MTGEFLPVGCISCCLLPYSQHAATVPTHHHSLLRIYALFNDQRKSNCEPVLDPGQMPVLQQPSPQIHCLGVRNYRLGRAGVKPVPYTWLASGLCQQDGPTQGSPAALTQYHVSSAAGALSTAVAIDTVSCKLGKLFSSSSNRVFL